VKILLLGLLPIILLSVIMVRQSILYYGIGIPVLILWIISAFVALIPDDVCRETTRGLLPDEILGSAGGVRRNPKNTQKADQAA
jgi:hypothetical protein